MRLLRPLQLLLATLALLVLGLPTVHAADGGQWVVPTSVENPSGLWVDPTYAYDGSISSYASDQSNAAGDGPWLVLNYDPSIRTDQVLIIADYGYDIVDSVALEASVGGVWVPVFSGAIDNDSAFVISFPTLQADAFRFRFHYLTNGFYFWLYDFRAYSMPAEVVLPQVETTPATAVTDVSAVLHGQVISDGGSPCAVAFAYRPAGSSTETTTGWASPITTGQGRSTLLLPVVGLQPGVPYVYHIIATNSAGTVVGADQSFTPTAVLPGMAEWLPGVDVHPDATAEMSWVAPTSAIDDDTTTAASCYHPLWAAQWSPDLLISLPAVAIDHVRVSAGLNPFIDAIAVDLQQPDGTWVAVYQGSFADMAWQVYPVAAPGLYTQARVRMHTNTTGVGTALQLFELQVRMPTLVSFATGADTTVSQPGHLDLPLRLQPATSSLPLTLTLAAAGAPQAGSDWNFTDATGSPAQVVIPAGTAAPTLGVDILAGSGAGPLAITLSMAANGQVVTPSQATVTITRAQAPTITWATPASMSWGTPLGAAQLNATTTVPGVFTYTPPAGTILDVGTQTLSVQFVATDPAYPPTTASVVIQVTKAQSVLTWATPAAINLGTALSATQCNASASAAGTISYVPAIGTLLPEGFHMLRATYVPTDAAHRTAAVAYVRIRVIDPVPPSTTYQYDNANRLTDRIYHDGKRDTFVYDPAGRLTSAVSQRYANTVGRDYDDANRLTEERLTIDGSTHDVGYSYDSAIRLTGMVYPDDSTVVRTYTARNQLEDVTYAGVQVAHRTYDAGGRLATTTWHPQQAGVTETRTYHAGSAMVATIQVPGVTDFAYDYDTVWRKSAERDLRDTTQSQHFRYDDASRLNDWRRGAAYATPASTRSWDLSLVGDWKQTVTDGVTENRTHTPVHEIATIGGQQLEHDYRGNLSRGLPYADGSEARYSWDVENRLATATASDADMDATGTASYRYDALGRRVQKTVWGETTTYIHAGAQVVQRTTVPHVLPAAAVDDDGDLVAANGRPPGADYLGGGGILTAAQQRVNYQPELSAIPEGFVADKGKAIDERSNLLTYGWDAVQAGQVERRAYPLPQFDTHIRLQAEGQQVPGTWSMALPNGTYAVVVVMGDPASRNQTNNITVNGTLFTDTTPATTEIEYRKGNFDGYIENITVTDGFLTISAQGTAFDPKLCFVEIGAEGVLATQAERDRLAAVIEAANNQTAKNKPASQDVASYVYGSYVDEVLCYQATVGVVTERYFPHYNHLYSVAALTDSTGAVTERFTYDGYGRQSITSAGGVSRMRSAVGWDRGFTGYISDGETGLLHARARQYSPMLGRFIGRDPIGYNDGFGLYSAYFVPNATDPMGLEVEIVINGVQYRVKTQAEVVLLIMFAPPNSISRIRIAGHGGSSSNSFSTTLDHENNNQTLKMGTNFDGTTYAELRDKSQNMGIDLIRLLKGKMKRGSRFDIQSCESAGRDKVVKSSSGEEVLTDAGDFNAAKELSKLLGDDTEVSGFRGYLVRKHPALGRKIFAGNYSAYHNGDGLGSSHRMSSLWDALINFDLVTPRGLR